MEPKIERVLSIIDELEMVPEDMQDLIFLHPHLLKENLKDFWAMDISGNWRIIFKFNKGFWRKGRFLVKNAKGIRPEES